ncbi:MAG: Re/Si-specific NAD(P)(+) transhydrogenase subunit alpha [Proteobacteria bacterium]|nr:Re/Si-specific NAD(P)(+) transhydrogenase subunit alpha [Pseudomonadota bacterium]
MKVGIPKERRPDEARVAGSPDLVKRLSALGVEVLVERGAGDAALIPDDVLAAAGATMLPDAAGVYGDSDVVLKVRRPLTVADGGPDEVAMMKPGAVLIGMLNPFADRDQVDAYAARKLTVFALELMPRISRAQAMDALSSQSNIAGYKAVIDAAAAYKRIFPMMMTAAGSIAPARVLVLGAGVAGLQAIATARRLGAIVSAIDVRSAAKQEVESLGAKFVEVDSGETGDAAGGYAKEMSDDYKRRQAALIHETLKQNDIVVTTALIPGKPAPLLITEDMVKDMKLGSVIVDMATAAGGNCALSERDRVVETHGVTIIGRANLPAAQAADTSTLYARNLSNVLDLLVDEETGELAIDWEDEIVKGMLITRDGEVVHPAFTA